MNEDEIRDLERRTREQAGSHEWFIEREKRLSASNFGKVMALKESTDPRNRVFDILYRSFHNEALQYGKQMEPVARSLFAEKFGKTIEDCGMTVCLEYPFLSASPGKLM